MEFAELISFCFWNFRENNFHYRNTISSGAKRVVYIGYNRNNVYFFHIQFRSFFSSRDLHLSMNFLYISDIF